MKRVLALLMLCAIIGGGLWLSQPDNRPVLNQLQEQATQLSREAGNRISNSVSVPLRQAAGLRWAPGNRGEASGVPRRARRRRN